MTTIQHTLYPRRLPAHKLEGAYPHMRDAFAARDYIYVAKYGQAEPELRGLSLIMLGNRVGGECVLDSHNVHTAQTCLYRAYAAWQESDDALADKWIADGLAIDATDARFLRFQALRQQKSFNLLMHSDACRLDMYHGLQGFRTIETRHLRDAQQSNLQAVDTAQKSADIRYLRFGQSIASVVPADFTPDLVLVDDMKTVPVGLRDVGAPVVVNFHDHEWYYEFLDDIAPEVDLFSTGGSSELIEVAKAFGRPATTQFYSIPVRMPKIRSIVESFSRTADRNLDILFTGGLTHDFYRDKRQTILPLTSLAPSYAIKILEGFLSHGDYDMLLNRTRFTISSVRSTNYLSTRTLDALSGGALNLVEEENAFPFIFSERFACFPSFAHDTALADIEKHLGNYEAIMAAFQPQAAQMEAELKSLFPDDDKERAARYLRHLLFVLRVESPVAAQHTPQLKPQRSIVHYNDYGILAKHRDHLVELAGITQSPHWMRLALTRAVLAPQVSQLQVLCDVVAQGLQEMPQSLALHYACGMCFRLLGKTDVAQQSFMNVATGNLVLLPHDPFPTILDMANSLYWVQDARIRDKCAGFVEPLARTESVWRSYAWTHLAEMALERALGQGGAVGEYAAAASHAVQALTLFKCGEGAQRAYLRAQFGLAMVGQAAAGDDFLQNFAVACQNDYMMLNDFAPMAIHLLMLRGNAPEAQKILNSLTQLLGRAALDASKYMLYPETRPILDHYGIPHGSGYKKQE